MGKNYIIITEGKLNGIFMGFAENNKFSDYEVFTFDNGGKWQQAEPYYYHYGMTIEPNAKVIQYGGAFYLIVDAVPDDINPILPRPVKVKIQLSELYFLKLFQSDTLTLIR